ncbi:hypothetical protein HO173_005836 [Letharia columbiana]|uniref:Uncharacterized protein n=1 Tax=Letharia columbiana TaxID=112416 RepID=A0A8H6FWR5_9LECA|nr:uncharacterized protein HO173_005836 [Letharia columbiana]KAF6236206.1 hypothetical protein HO173_005836 [Letharia columbiana]
MTRAGGVLKPKMAVPYVRSQQENERDTATTENAKAESSSSVPKEEEEEKKGSSQDLCSSKSISDRQNGAEPRPKQGTEDSKAVKAESSSSGTKDGEASRTPRSEKVSAAWSSEQARDWDRVVMGVALN